MKEVSVEEILHQYNLIVPEIQREYVWGYNQYGIFETFINDIKEGFESEGELSPEIISLQQTILNPAIDETTRKSLTGVLESLKKPVNSLNIGFLYSYKPSYYIGNDREEDLYLIDGQQRFTTLFLILFYFSLKENRKIDFELLFKFDPKSEHIAFDYRVRSITHQFIIDLVDKSNTVKDLLTVRDRPWFLANYANDVTVKSIVGVDGKSGVFRLLDSAFKEDSRLYFDFVRKEIKFWHFKTEETSQGEELYITMNSRGQQLADNETIRARLFDDEEVKNNSLLWSEKWEIWQDFFWKNRDKSVEQATADDGFNEFLRWVQLLRMYEVFPKNGSTSAQTQSFEKALQWEQGSKLDIKYLSLRDIEITFLALKHIFVEFKSAVEKEIAPLYKYCKKLDLISENWLANSDGSISLIDAFLLLPVLRYCKNRIGQNEQIDNHALLRLTRALYSLSKDDTISKGVRTHVFNALTLVDTLQSHEDLIALQSNQGISKALLNDELKTKLEAYSKTSKRVELEDIFWFAEDFENNDGEIRHLIDFFITNCNGSIDDFNIERFQDLVMAYKELFDCEDIIWGDLLGTEVYVNYGDRVSYDRYWYKSADFLNFTMDRLANVDMGLSNFLIRKRKQFISRYETIDEIQSEELANKQLYIFYILQNHLIKDAPGWDWGGGRWNFGIYDSYPGFSSPFTKSNIYQSIRDRFQVNSQRILYINQKNVAKKILFSGLIGWAKS